MPPQIATTLLRFGFSLNEARAYEALLMQSAASVPELAKKLGLHRRNMYDALDRLEKKQFVTRVSVGGIDRYEAAPPRAILLEHEKKEKEFLSILPELETIQKNGRQKNTALTIFTNANPSEIIRTIAQASSTIQSLNISMTSLLSEYRGELEKFLKKEKSRKRRWILYNEPGVDYEENTIALLRDISFIVEPRKVKRKNLPCLLLVDESLSLFPELGKPEVNVLLRSKSIVKQYSTLLEAAGSIVPRGTIPDY